MRDSWPSTLAYTSITSPPREDTAVYMPTDNYGYASTLWPRVYFEHLTSSMDMRLDDRGAIVGTKLYEWAFTEPTDCGPVNREGLREL